MRKDTTYKVIFHKDQNMIFNTFQKPSNTLSESFLKTLCTDIINKKKTQRFRKKCLTDDKNSTNIVFIVQKH